MAEFYTAEIQTSVKCNIDVRPTDHYGKSNVEHNSYICIHNTVKTNVVRKMRSGHCTFMNTTHWCPVYNRHAHVALIDVNT